jgi:hypothetical protein
MDQIAKPMANAPPTSQTRRLRPDAVLTRLARSSAAKEAVAAINTDSAISHGS